MSVELELIRPALELAVEVARSGCTATPPVDPPRALVPFLRFRRIPAKALVAARRVIDGDEEFRARVAAEVVEAEGVEGVEGAVESAVLGRAAVVYLTRPDGWEQEFGDLVELAERDHAIASETAAAVNRDRSAERLGRQVEELRRTLADSEASRHTEEQRARSALQRVDAMAQALDGAEASLNAAEAARQRAVRELKATERRLAERIAEVKELSARVEELEAEVLLQQGDALAADAVASAVQARQSSDALLVETLRERWDALAPALGEIQRLLAVPPGDAASTPAELLKDAQTARSSAGGATGPGNSRSTAEHAGSARAVRRAPRLPARIAPGSAEATRWLLSRPNLTVFVDGYNVTMLGWPELNATEQRSMLERSARRLQARHGCRVVLVFDGDGEGGRDVRTALGSPVRVMFTEASVEADDEILRQLDLGTEPAVVVSNDRRVQTGAQERGAVVMSSTEFLTILS